MKQFYKGAILYWGLLLIAVLLLFLGAEKNQSVPANQQKKQSKYAPPVEQLFLLHADVNSNGKHLFIG